MRKRIYREFALIVMVIEIITSTILYFAFSHVLLQNTQKNMYYSLKLLDSGFTVSTDYDFNRLDLAEVLTEENSRLTIIGTDGTVYLDTGAQASTLENHLERQEVKDAIKNGNGEAIRYSETMRMNMLYVAILTKDSRFVYRLSLPYHGLAEYSGTLLPILGIVLGVSLVIALLFAYYFSRSITDPLQEISQELDNFKNELPVEFKEYNDEELKTIVTTTQQMCETITKNLQQLEKDKQIRQEFFSNASHELKTPLTSIKGYVELLASGVTKDPKQIEDFYQRILHETDNMTRLIQDILTISRLESQEVLINEERMNLRVETNEVVKDLETSADQQQVTIDNEVTDEDIMFVPLHYHQILTNLVSNAINYNHPGGRVEINVKVVNQKLLISVADTGVGISPENQQRVFERFYRVDSGRSKKTGGTGLGLAIVKHLVKYHQGTIELVSKVSVGTQFTVSIPLVSHV